MQTVYAVYDCAPGDEIYHASLCVYATLEGARLEAVTRAPGVTPVEDREDDGNLLGYAYTKADGEQVYVTTISLFG